MTEDELDAEIAELAGWVPLGLAKDYAGNPFPEFIPMYSKDLNQCYLAEERILGKDDALWQQYTDVLTAATKGRALHATAKQRVNALIKVTK